MIKSINYDASQCTLIRKFFNLKRKFKRISLNIWFLQECRKRGLLPNFTRIRSDNNSPSAVSAIRKAREVWLITELRRAYLRRDETSKETYFFYNKITAVLHPIQLDNLYSSIFHNLYFFGQSLHRKLNRKLSILMLHQTPLNNNNHNNHHDTNFKFFNNVLNLSETNFSEHEHALLDKGLNYSTHSHSSRNLKSLCAQTDAILNTISNKFNTNIDYNRIINCFNTCKPINVNGRERLSLLSIKNKLKSENLLITKADKGNCLVIQNKSTYLTKTLDLLNSIHFTKLARDPTSNFQNKLKSTLNNLHPTFFEFFNTSKNHFIFSNPLPPRLYCLPKIHKQDIPYRPIVSSNNSPCHKLASFLSQQLPITLNFRSQFSIKNSSILCQDLKDLTIAPTSILFSFDVINLFNSIPPSACLDILKNSLTFSDIPDLIADNLLTLTQLTLHQDFFLFNNTFYKQTLGLAMGSPLSPFLAELFMHSLENTVSKSPLFKHILVWKRYVDDIFGIFNGTKEQLMQLHQYLNTIHPHIKFTLEIEDNNSIPFLDITISKHNNKLKFNIYRKSTTTKRLIPFNSAAPLSHKLAAFRFFFNRLTQTPLDPTDYEQELNTIFYLAHSNSFPFKIINNLYKKILSNHNIRKHTSLTHLSNENLLYFSLPYFPNISDKLATNIRRQFPQIRISFSTSDTKLMHFISKAKDNINPSHKHGIYKLNCPCGKFYIGRTIRNFQTRTKEHITQIKNHLKRGSPMSSAFSTHTINCKHVQFILNNSITHILHSGGKTNFLNSLESLEILLHKHRDGQNLLNNITDFSDNRFLPYVIDYL